MLASGSVQDAPSRNGTKATTPQRFGRRTPMLKTLKIAHDPDNVFHLNQNIETG